MKYNIFKSLDESFIQNTFQKKINVYFPDLKNKKIKNIKIKRTSPDWAKDTCLTRYIIFLNDNERKIIRGTAKIEKSKESVWQVMNYLYHQGNLSIAKPLDFIKNINLLLYEEAVGSPFNTIIEKNNFQIIKKNVKKIARWLTKLHNLRPKSKKIPKAFFIGLEGYLKIMELIKEFMPQIKNNLISSSKLTFLNKIWQPEAIIHNDFYPGNIIIGFNDFIVIDFDRSGIGPSLMDIATLYGALEFPKEVWPVNLPSKKIQQFQKFFLTTYCKLNNLDYQKTLKKLKPFLAKIFLDQVCYYTSFIIKGWQFQNQKEKLFYINKIKKLLLKVKECLP